MQCRLVLLLTCLLPAAGITQSWRTELPTILFSPADTVENFDDGAVALHSYPGQDAQPDSWCLDSIITAQHSPYSLRLFGNTWKLESIPALALDIDDIWQVSAYVESLGEIQGFGLTDSAHTLLYAFAGTELLNTDTWITVYQGAFPLQQWNCYQLPVGQDWLARFGYLPVVHGIVFLNDRDTDPRASVYFDEVIIITRDLPVAPQVRIWHTQNRPYCGADARLRVDVQFHSEVIDPDSRQHRYCWYFGDDSTSTDSHPRHSYLITDDHEYTVLLQVLDSTGLRGWARDRVVVDPGPTTFPVRINFVGDIMLARRYDIPGGLIDTLGVNALFAPTLPFLGNAADITVANLESPLTAQGTRHPTKPIVFRGRPRNVAGLAYAGIDVVSLANNHIIDYGLPGMRETQESLAANGICYSGAGANSYEAYLPVFALKSGVNIAFLASCNRTGQYDNYQPYLNAGFNKPGFAELDSFHLQQQTSAVESLADIIVVTMHSGNEYSPVPPSLEPDADDEFYSPRAFTPDLRDIALRHQAIDAGADLVVNHHPHILQGFEVYNHKLIAHSLGNFAFDLDYAETYPSVILNGRIDATGFYDYSVTPVWIDDYIPRPARGELGLRILDYLAQRSRDLGTYLAVQRDSIIGQVVLDTLTMTRIVNPFQQALSLRRKDGLSLSAPLRLPRTGNLSALTQILPAGNWQYRLGRDIIWFGNFEDEGSTMWLLNQTGEQYDTIRFRGRRSLSQRRATGTSQITTNLETRLPCLSDSARYTVYGNIRTRNGRNGTLAVKCYTVRTGGSVIGTGALDTVITGTCDWAFYHNEFLPAPGTKYFDLWLQSEAPQSGDSGLVWFDDVGIIAWEEWCDLSVPVPIRSPNDYYWLQLRTADSVTSAALAYNETGYQPGVTGVRPAPPAAQSAFLKSYPNPFHSTATIQYQLAEPSAVRLTVYNVLGQPVRELINGIQPPGMKSIVWDGRDNQAQALSSGTYFCRLQVGYRVETNRLILLR